MCCCMHAELVAQSVRIPIDTKSRFVYIKGHLQGQHLLHQGHTQSTLSRF